MLNLMLEASLIERTTLGQEAAVRIVASQDCCRTAKADKGRGCKSLSIAYVILPFSETYRLLTQFGPSLAHFPSAVDVAAC